MSWFQRCKDPLIEGLVVVPSPNALVQNLGPFLSGRLMHTDILPQSALVCASENGKPLIDDDGQVRFAFEGNANGAANLERYHERCQAAAGRLATRAPSIAYGASNPRDLKVVARMNLLRFTFTEIIDPKAMEAWSGESVKSFMPPADLETPTSDPDITSALCDLPMKPLTQNRNGIYIWSLLDGTLLTMDTSDKKLTAWRPGDKGLKSVLEAAGMSVFDQFKMSI
jgi:hypothetical protein